jgi:tetratricopeptide (TPR) repeat protein
MPDADVDEQLEYFIAHVRLLLEGKTMEGLSVWAQRFGELRQISQFELCQRLANAIRTADLPKHGLGVVRYGEGWLYDRMGRWQDAIKAYEASLTAFQEAGVPLDATLLTQIGSIYQDQGDWPAAGLAYERAIAAAGADDHARGLALNNLGGLELVRGQLAAAEHHYTEACELLRDRDKRNFAAATHGLAGVLRDRGRLQESQQMELECLTLFQSLGDTHGVGSAIGSIATTQLYGEQYREAIHNYEVALQIFVETGDHVNTTRTLSNLSIAHQELGEYDPALEYLTQAVDGYREVADRYGEAAAAVNLARLHSKRNDQVAAHAASDAAKELCELFGFPQELSRLPRDVQ